MAGWTSHEFYWTHETENFCGNIISSEELLCKYSARYDSGSSVSPSGMEITIVGVYREAWKEGKPFWQPLIGDDATYWEEFFESKHDLLALQAEREKC